jgi:ribosome biogenesis GTPase
LYDTPCDALVPFGWGPRVQTLLSDAAEPGAVPGRVTRADRDLCRVVTEAGEVAARWRVVGGDTAPAVGDWVALRALDHDLVAEAVVPRWSALVRGDPDSGSVQTLAANVDVVLVTAPSDRLSPTRVERELVLAWDSGAQPIVAVTKCDLASPNMVDELRARLATVDVIATSAVTGEGIDSVANQLAPNRTAVLFGPSGAGKSSLANALLAEERLAVSEVRERDHRGRHTTTWRELVVVPTGGVLIDTPGLRGLALGNAGEGLARTFEDIDALAPSCRFNDCSHTAEPGCEVLAAIADGRLARERLVSWRKLQRELTLREPGRRHEERAIGRKFSRGQRQRRVLDHKFDPRRRDDHG